MKKFENNIAIILICIILGVILAIQFKTVNLTTDGIISTQKAQQLTIELKNLKNEKEELFATLSELEARIKEYEESESKGSVYVKRLSEDIQKYKMISGYEDVQGPGVVVTIDDPPMEVQFGDLTSNMIYNYDLLLEIISNLNAAGAEAISINEQRYTNYTEIVPVGNHININGVSFVPPFVIKAIGYTQTLESALNFPGGIIWRIRSQEFEVEVKPEKNIRISRYTKNKDFKYAEPIVRTN